MDKFKSNFEELKAQQQSFSNSGIILKNIFSIYSLHPWYSLFFVIIFGIKVNLLSELLIYITTTTQPTSDTTNFLLFDILISIFLLLAIFFRIWFLHKDLFQITPINQKKVLITLVSKSRTNFKHTPSFNTYNSLLYTDLGHATTNLLEKVVLITTNLSEVKQTANELKSFIEASGRKVEIFELNIEQSSIINIEKQFSILFNRLKGKYRPHEIIADYTGGTKEMSISLFKASENELVLAVYLKEAQNGNYSKYQA